MLNDRTLSASFVGDALCFREKAFQNTHKLAIIYACFVTAEQKPRKKRKISYSFTILESSAEMQE